MCIKFQSMVLRMFHVCVAMCTELLSSQVPKRAVSKTVVLADVPLYRLFWGVFWGLFTFWQFGAVSLPKGGDTQTKCPFSELRSVKCRGGRGSKGVDNAPRAESSTHDGTHICTLRRYGGTTPVPAGGTTVPPLYPQEVRRYHRCTCRWYACAIPVFLH